MVIAIGYKAMHYVNTAKRQYTPNIGIILAGGLSSRMGTNKALLQLPSGKTLLENCYDTLSQCNVDKIYISGDYPGYDCINDIVPNMGPFGAMYTASQLVEQPAKHLFIPVDMPLMSPSMLDPLLDIPDYYDSSCYRQTCLPFVLHMNSTIQAILEILYLTCDRKKSLSVQYVLDLLNTRYLPAASYEKHLTNVNTPTQWKMFLKRFIDKYNSYEYSIG